MMCLFGSFWIEMPGIPHFVRNDIYDGIRKFGVKIASRGKIHDVPIRISPDKVAGNSSLRSE